MSDANDIHEAFKQGDLETLLIVLDEPPARLNVPYTDAFGHCLEYAIYHSPLSLIQRLLELGADPNYPDHAGFPALIAVLTTAGRTEIRFSSCSLPVGRKFSKEASTALPLCTWQRRLTTSARRSRSEHRPRRPTARPTKGGKMLEPSSARWTVR